MIVPSRKTATTESAPGQTSACGSSRNSSATGVQRVSDDRTRERASRCCAPSASAQPTRTSNRRRGDRLLSRSRTAGRARRAELPRSGRDPCSTRARVRRPRSRGRARAQARGSRERSLGAARARTRRHLRSGSRGTLRCRPGSCPPRRRAPTRTRAGAAAAQAATSRPARKRLERTPAYAAVIRTVHLHRLRSRYDRVAVGV